MEDAYHKMPNSLDYATNLAKAYYTPREYKKIIQILSAFPESSNPSYEIHLFLGKSHQALGEYDNDVEIYNKAISHFGIDVNLLNPMEECYNRLGSMDEALAVNPDQPQIKKIIKNIKE